MTEVMFNTSDPLEQRIFDSAEHAALSNIRDFAGRRVMVEGGGYEKIWIETQPMGGEMYAKRNLEIGLNNQLLFMECQREDGRLPGPIACMDGKLVPQFGQFQGFCFAEPALNMYYLTGRDQNYLQLLYSTLERYDAYLWRTRDSDGDGCLELWCQYDTGEDRAMRFADAPNRWPDDTPPSGFAVVPIASMDIMGYSYSARNTLAKISRMTGHNEDAKTWQFKADYVLNIMHDYLWNEDRGAYFDRDNQHRIMPTLIHNTLRTMYWRALTPRMAHEFVTRHLLNPDEFWTCMPLPSVAVNDPLFRNVSTNNWSGACEALTYQRAIRALENYEYYQLIPQLGRRLMESVGENSIFVQQFDPFTGTPYEESHPGRKQVSYGPCILSVLEYLSRMHGIHIDGETIVWGSSGKCTTDYMQRWNEREYRVTSDGSVMTGFVDGIRVFRLNRGSRAVTDWEGHLLSVSRLEEEPR